MQIVEYKPNYLRSGFYDEIFYDEETTSLIDIGDDTFSVGDPEDEDFNVFSAEGGKNEFKCIITDNPSFLLKQRESEQVAGQLLMVALICFVFMVVEFVGGFMSNSSAIMTDAAHMLSDVCALIVSVFAIKMGGLAPSPTKSYGYHRAEVLGALTSIIIIWILVAWLCFEATRRVFAVVNGVGFPLDPFIMLLTSFVSLLCNTLNLYFLGMCSGDGHGIVDNVHSIFKPHG